MEYNLGVIGIGHWFRRLYAGISSVGGIKISKALGTRSFESKAEMLEGFGISKGMYYTTGKDGKIPSEFFSGIDAVHISDPNSLHADQLKDTLSKGKKAIVEKTFAISKVEFDGVVKFIKNSNSQDAAYLHLHYLHKLPTIELASSIDGMISKHGKISRIDSCFFEGANDEDAKRGWLFGMENGGLFMDWIHPFEVVYHTTKADFGAIEKLRLYATNESYDDKNPTGIFASLNVSGSKFMQGATFNVSVAKGTPERYSKKGVMVIFESGNYVRLEYIGSEKESRGSRGLFETGRIEKGKRTISFTKPLSGDSSSEIFVREIFELCGGMNKGLTIGEIESIFKPQWDYQKQSKGVSLIKDAKEVASFLESGINCV